MISNQTFLKLRLKRLHKHSFRVSTSFLDVISEDAIRRGNEWKGPLTWNPQILSLYCLLARFQSWLGPPKVKLFSFVLLPAKFTLSLTNTFPLFTIWCQQSVRNLFDFELEKPIKVTIWIVVFMGGRSELVFCLTKQLLWLGLFRQ